MHYEGHHEEYFQEDFAGGFQSPSNATGFWGASPPGQLRGLVSHPASKHGKENSEGGDPNASVVEVIERPLISGPSPLEGRITGITADEAIYVLKYQGFEILQWQCY